MPSESLHLQYFGCHSKGILAKQYLFGRSKLLLFFLARARACLSTSSPLCRQQDGKSVPMGIRRSWMSSSLNFVLNFHYSCALSVGFLNIYTILASCSWKNPWLVPPLHISYHWCTLSYFISLSDIERGVQCKIMETKTKEKAAIKTLNSSMQWYCFAHRQPCQHKGSEVCSH